MIVSHESKLEYTKINNELTKGASIKALISPNEGWDGHVMRVLELEVGGHSPRHEHPWPHINYILEGQGIVFLDGEEIEVKSGSYAYIPSGKMHQFINTGTSTFKFICIVPEEGHK